MRDGTPSKDRPRTRLVASKGKDEKYAITAKKELTRITKKLRKKWGESEGQ